jgi:hypothetical protein
MFPSLWKATQIHNVRWSIIYCRSCPSAKVIDTHSGEVQLKSSEVSMMKKHLIEQNVCVMRTDHATDCTLCWVEHVRTHSNQV